MRDCWQEIAECRPSFTEIVSTLDTLLAGISSEVSNLTFNCHSKIFWLSFKCNFTMLHSLGFLFITSLSVICYMLSVICYLLYVICYMSETHA